MRKNSTKRVKGGKKPAEASYFALPLLVVVLLQFIGLVIPVQMGWGFNFWRLISAPWNYIFLGVALLLVVPPVNRLVAASGAFLLGPPVRLISRIPIGVVAATATPLLFAVFFYFRSRAYVYGDGFMVLTTHTDLSRPVDLGLHYMKPLVVLFDRTLYGLLSSFIEASPALLLAAIKAAGGVVGFWAIYRISRLLAVEASSRWLIMAGTMASGTIILFFGYMETYTWATALGLWSLAFSVGYLSGKNKIWPALLFGAVAGAFHLFAFPFLLVALLAFADKKVGLFEPPRFRWLILGTIGLSLMAALVGQIAPWPHRLVNLWPTEGLPYWFLSPPHLLDMANQIFLVAPLGIILLLFSIGKRQETVESSLRIDRLLVITSISTFLAAFWIDPSLGAPRDWDFLSFFGFPLSILGIYRLANRTPAGGVYTRQLAGVVVVGLVCIVPNLVEKHDLGRAAARLDYILWRDPHYQMDYMKAERCIPWSFTLRTNVGDKERGLKYLHRRGAAAKEDHVPWFSLGEYFLDRRMYDSAYHYLHRAVAVGPTKPYSLIELSLAEEALGMLDEAWLHLESALELAPDDANVNSAMAIFLTHINRTPEGLTYFRRGCALAPDDALHAANLGSCFRSLEQFDSASYYLERAMSLTSDIMMKTVYGEALIHSALALGDRQKARDVWRLISPFEPGSPRMERLRIIIESNKYDSVITRQD